jgi:hypothetical protein
MTTMVDHIQLGKHYSPWEPSGDAQLLATYLYYDIPRMGTISQHGEVYLFRCIEGYADDIHVWAYAPVRAEDLDELDKANGTPEIWELLRRATLGVSMSFAVASDADGILSVWNDDDLRNQELSILDTGPLMGRVVEAVARAGELPEDIQHLLQEMATA